MTPKDIVSYSCNTVYTFSDLKQHRSVIPVFCRSVVLPGFHWIKTSVRKRSFRALWGGSLPSFPASRSYLHSSDCGLILRLQSQQCSNSLIFLFVVTSDHNQKGFSALRSHVTRLGPLESSRTIYLKVSDLNHICKVFLNIEGNSFAGFLAVRMDISGWGRALYFLP